MYTYTDIYTPYEYYSYTKEYAVDQMLLNLS